MKMMAWAQHFQRYNALAAHAAPPGWMGQWPPPAPPVQQPPVPQGVDPRRWQAGHWQFNTAFNFTQPAQAQTKQWLAHPAWGPAAADFNPYKRIARPGDAEYYRQPLSKNPLGLTDMIPAAELEKQRQQEEQEQEELNVQRTPWLWAPGNELPEDENGDHSQQSTRHTHHRHRSSSAHPRAPEGSSSSRQASWGRAAGQDAARNTNGHVAQSAASSSFAQHQDRYQQRGHVPVIPERRHSESSDTNGSSASTQARSHTIDVAAAWSVHADLQPTFSPKIVRTPDSYMGSSSASAAAAAAAAAATASSRRAPEDESTTPRPSRRRSTRESSSSKRAADRRSSREEGSRDSPARRRHKRRDSSSSDDSPPPGPHTHGRIYGPPTPTSARINSNGTTSSTQQSISSLSSSMGSLSVKDSSTVSTTDSNQSFLQQPFLSEEPIDLLSPLLMPAVPPRTPEKQGKELTRSQTYPSLPSSGHTSPFPPIPEEPLASNGTRSSASGQISRTPSSKTPKRSPSQHSPRTPKSLGRSRTYPNVNEAEVSPVIPPRPETFFTSAARNPLPTPPKDVISSSSASSSLASQSYHNNSASRTSPQHRYSADTHSRAQAQPHPSSYYSTSSSQTQYMSSASTAAQQQQQQQYQQQRQQHQPQQQQPQQQQHTPVRKRHGYWNKRGDHLVIVGAPTYATSTDDQKDRHYIVYAPREQANPDDLAAYPAPTAGWMDHRGRTLKYDPNTPELPESLPSRGEPPVRPYQSFLQYVYI